MSFWFRLFCQGTIALTVFSLVSCVSESEVVYALPEFKEEKSARLTILSEELLGLNRIVDVCLYGQYIVVAGYDAENNTFLHIFDRCGERLLDTVHMGRGPREILWGNTFWFNKSTGKALFCDITQNKAVMAEIDSLMVYGAVPIREEHYGSLTWVTHICNLDDGKTIKISNVHSDADSTGVDRIVLLDENGQMIAKYRDFPESDSRKRFIIYNEQEAAISPDGEKMAIGTLWGCVLEIFSISDGIELKDVEYFIEPDFIAHSGYGEMTENTRFGFIDIDVTDDLIYTVIDGETYPLRSQGNFSKDEKKHGNNISIFDWDGRPVRKIMTDYEIKRFCIDENDETVYAVVTDSFGRHFLGKFHIDI